jgi:hypothetical protein
VRAIDCFHFHPYDTEEYDFAGTLARELFKVDELSKLHEAEHAACDLPRTLTYNDNLRLRARMAALPRQGNFFNLYRKFAEKEIAPLFGGAISYTRIPTFRVQMAGTESISKWHTDAEVTGRIDQIVCWTPFVDVHETATIWCETDYGRKDYVPIDVCYGEVLMFDGALLSHGSVPNRTDISRVSMDFRVMPKRLDRKDAYLGVLSARPPSLAQSVCFQPLTGKY